MHRFPKDRFDVRPRRGERVGVHRSAAHRPHGWITPVVSLIVIAVLVGAGFFAVHSTDGLLGARTAAADLEPPASTATPAPASHATPSAPPSQAASPTPTAVLDPDVSMIVLNGTTRPGLAHAVTQTMQEGGWVNMRTPVNAPRQDVQHTTVYYAGAQNENAALGAVRTLTASGVLAGRDIPVEAADPGATGGAGAAVTVVIGQDYEGTRQ